MRGVRIHHLAGVVVAALLAAPGPVHAAVISFQGNLAGFNAAAGSPPVSIDFDSIAPGTNIAGSTISGVTFSSPPGNTLEVDAAASTFTPGGSATNRLFATSGANVLSPGGPSLDLVPDGVLTQKDSLRLVFGAPVSAFGLDILFQSLDFASFTSFEIRDASDTLLLSGAVDTSGVGGGAGAPGGTFFIGFVSSTANIARIDFIETDDGFGNPDSNIGYDTLRFVAASTSVPEPGTLLLLGLGIAALAAISHRRHLSRLR